jgi:hypothetical protein
MCRMNREENEFEKDHIRFFFCWNTGTSLLRLLLCDIYKISPAPHNIKNKIPMLLQNHLLCQVPEK